MQEGGSLEGDRLVYFRKKGKDRVVLFSEKLAPFEAESPGTTAPGEVPEIQLSPAVVASAISGAPERGKRCKSSEGDATASSGTAGKPLTAQQHSVVAALMVVIKRAMLEGQEAVLTALTRLLCNNLYTVVVLEHLKDDLQELPSIRSIEQALGGEGQDLVDLLARQCAAAGFQPLQVFSRSVQCGARTACKLGNSIAAANSPQRAAALTRFLQVRELDRAFGEHSLPPTWGQTTVSLLVRQGVAKSMAELIMLLPPLLDEICKRCFYPSDSWQGGAREYAALDHFLPGSCHLCTIMYRLANMVACISSATMQIILCIMSIAVILTSMLHTDFSLAECLVLDYCMQRRCCHNYSQFDAHRWHCLQVFWTPHYIFLRGISCVPEALPSWWALRRKCCKGTRHALWHLARPLGM